MSEFATDWDQKPWWRSMSLAGWSLLALAVFASTSFVFGIVTGETLLLLAIKSKSGSMQFGWRQSPGWFSFAMSLNAVVAAGIWLVFAAWLRERHLHRRERPSPRARQ